MNNLKTARHANDSHSENGYDRDNHIDCLGCRLTWFDTYDTDHVRIPNPMRSADWPVARQFRGPSAQTQTVTLESELDLCLPHLDGIGIGIVRAEWESDMGG